jgi:hypothetical protein
MRLNQALSKYISEALLREPTFLSGHVNIFSYHTGKLTRDEMWVDLYVLEIYHLFFSDECSIDKVIYHLAEREHFVETCCETVGEGILFTIFTQMQTWQWICDR